MPRVVRFLMVLVVFVAAGLPPLSLAAEEEGNDGLRYGGGRQEYGQTFDEGISDLDVYWAAVFEGVGVPYRSPQVRVLDSAVRSGCGPPDASSGPFYCPLDETIYLSFAVIEQIGVPLSDYMVITVTAHEWGHHVQNLLGVTKGTGLNKEIELQADCLAGAFTLQASEDGRLEPGDISEAATLSIAVGDPHWVPADDPNGHGYDDERLVAFMDGYRDGLEGCRLPLPSGGVVAVAVPTRPVEALPSPPSLPPAQPAAPLGLPSLVPPTLSLPQGQPFRLEEEGGRGLDEIATGFPDAVEAGRLLREWGFQDNLFRNYASDDPPPDAAGWVELSLHRFATADGAAAALPYYADSRAAALGLRPIDLGLFGDQSAAVAGATYGGQEVTIYARRGNILVRTTGITPSGDPTGDVIDVALIPLLRLIDEPRLVSPELLGLLPTETHLPPVLRLAEEHARSASTTAATFADPSDAERRFESWGWRESASRVFLAPESGTAAGTTRFEVVAYRLADDRSASEALVYFLDAREAALGMAEVAAPAFGDEARAIAGAVEGGREATVYARFGPVLLRFSAMGTGDPMVDLEALLGPA